MAIQKSAEISSLTLPDDIFMHTFSFISNSSSIMRLAMSSKKLNRNIWFYLLKFPHKTTLGLAKDRLLFWTNSSPSSEELTLAIKEFLTRKEVDFEAGLLATLVLAKFTDDKAYLRNLKAIHQLHPEKKLVSLCLEWLNPTSYLKRTELLQQIRAACNINHTATESAPPSSSIEYKKQQLLNRIELLLDPDILAIQRLSGRSTMPLFPIDMDPKISALKSLKEMLPSFEKNLQAIKQLIISLMPHTVEQVHEVAHDALSLLLEIDTNLATDPDLLKNILEFVQAKSLTLCEVAARAIVLFLKFDTSLAVIIEPIILKHLKDNVHRDGQAAYSLRRAAFCLILPALLRLQTNPKLLEDFASIIIALLGQKADTLGEVIMVRILQNKAWEAICPLLEAVSKLGNFNKVIALFDTIELEKIDVSNLNPLVLAKSLIALANQSEQLRLKISKLLQQSNCKINLSLLDFPTIMELVKLSASQTEVSHDEKTQPAMGNG